MHAAGYTAPRPAHHDLNRPEAPALDGLAINIAAMLTTRVTGMSSPRSSQNLAGLLATGQASPSTAKTQPEWFQHSPCQVCRVTEQGVPSGRD